MNQKKRSHAQMLRRVAALLLFLLLFIPYVVEQNEQVVFTPVDVQSENLPASFEGFRVLHVSDLHDKDFGARFEAVAGRCEAFRPDAVCITGDLIDTKDMEHALGFVRRLARIAPVYYVPGNHERQVGAQVYARLKAELSALGVRVLEDEAAVIARGGEEIAVVGVRDPAFDEGGGIWGETEAYEARLAPLRGGAPFALLLAHRPEHFDAYAAARYDLTLSGHEHGGLVRFPLVGPLVGLNQGLLPRYTAGLHYADSGMALNVSRGIGNNPRWSRRLNNPPEIVLITLHRGKTDR